MMMTHVPVTYKKAGKEQVRAVLRVRQTIQAPIDHIKNYIVADILEYRGERACFVRSCKEDKTERERESSLSSVSGSGCERESRVSTYPYERAPLTCPLVSAGQQQFGRFQSPPAYFRSTSRHRLPDP